MNSCVSCLTWLITIPVLFFATFLLGPWLLVLFGVVVVIGVVTAAGASPGTGNRSACPTCGRPYEPQCLCRGPGR